MSKLETNTIDTVSGTSTLQVGSTNTSTITLGVSGDTVNVPSGVTINNNGTQTGFGGDLTPAFSAYLSANQVASDASWTKVQCNTEIYDTDNCYDNATNYRFTPTTAGKYFLYCQIYGDVGNANDWNYTITILRKNGASIKSARIDLRNSPGREGSTFLSTVVDMNGSTDYVELWGQVYAQDNAGMLFLNTETYFGGYKIIE